MARCRAVDLLLAACVLSACATSRPTPSPEVRSAAGTTTVIYLVRRHWHIDVGFAVPDLGSPLKSVADDFPTARYVFFGFGDRHYLLAKHHGGPTLIGALWPGPALILMTAIEGSPAAAFGASQVLELRVYSKNARDAQAFIWHSMLSDAASQRAAPYAAGPYEGSVYFSAAATYSVLHTCNTWAAEVLKSASLPINSEWMLFAAQLWSSAGKLAEAAHPRASLPGHFTASG